MSTDSWDKMEKAKEDAHFEKQNREALARLQQKSAGRSRLSPITGEPMDQITIMGVNVDKCPKSGGIWLDAGELEQIIKQVTDGTVSKENWISQFFSSLFKK